MITFHHTTVQLSLGSLAERIRRAPSFRFESLWFQVTGPAVSGERLAKELLLYVVGNDDVWRTLRGSFDDMYDAELEVSTPHEHSTFVQEEDRVEALLAQAAANRLSPYSVRTSPATQREIGKIRRAFAAHGPYEAMELVPGSQEGCQGCLAHNNHLFSTWFYGVAWDWCFVVWWPSRAIACLLVLTGTD